MAEKIPRIITADCPFPREIDDGLFVNPLDEERELYEVGVCVVDTSKLYGDPIIRQQAMTHGEAKYYDLPGGERGYDPMIDVAAIKKAEFTEGNDRDAMVIRFNIGPADPPSTPDVSFEPVRVARNFNYADFALIASTGKNYKFRRVADLIRGHLGYVAYGDSAGFYPEWREVTSRIGGVIADRHWKSGSKINEAFMVGTNHIIGGTLAREADRSVPYRMHDPNDPLFEGLLPPELAYFSVVPGWHQGLRLRPYCRVTSPLRRLDDFVMNYQLHQRYQGVPATEADHADVLAVIDRLNEAIATSAMERMPWLGSVGLLEEQKQRSVRSRPLAGSTERIPA